MTEDLKTLREALEQASRINPFGDVANANSKMAAAKALAALSRLEAAAAAEYERGRQDGMKQEHALWKLAQAGQAIDAAAVPELSREDVMRLAREAGFPVLGPERTKAAERFASLVRSVPLTGETNAQLAVHPNHAESEQQRPMAGAVALGQPLGGSADPSAGHPAAEGNEHVTLAPYGIVYEYDGPFGLHQSFTHEFRNGKYPDRSFPVYTDRRSVPVGEVKPVAEVRESQPINPSGETVKAAFLMDKSLPAGTLLYTAPPAPIEGWRMVPVEPTPEMERAAFNELELPGTATETGTMMRNRVYRAMLAAAP